MSSSGGAMSVVSFIRNAYSTEADERQSRAVVLVRMLLILVGGVVVTAIAAALMFGVASLIWGGTIANIVQQVAGV
ncbi:hypothetical protein [Humibacter ginsenosidimutans]|uniref:Uncharacterized protein n=1 Tax=Humibacter ginsenosidimutans TaxID=2599293 RepID=A0A5B8M668_9MICO|nr:hypothetical protein [Humibacter ginsenosidimutans]QDZ15843.1 hypothetical protein FPZ11_14640 [Humibacter ginsenosidimutans]